MKCITIIASLLTSQIAGLGTAIGLASALVIALLLGAQPASEAHAHSPIPQFPSQRVQLPTAPNTSLLVGISPDYWPMEYISDTQIVGHDVDLMNAVAAEMSVTVVYTDVVWDRILTGLVEGKYDAVISTLSVTPDRDEMIDFTLPYVTFVGNDDIAIAVEPGNNMLRSQINEALWQLRAEGTLGAIVADIAADVPAWEPRLPDWPYIPPDTESTLVYTHTKGNSTLIQVPAGAVTETTLLAYTAVNTVAAPSGFAPAGHAFDLEAYQTGVLASGFTFSVPVTVAIRYTETNLVGIDEATLRLAFLNSSTSKWEDAATTCMPHTAYDRQPNENWLTVRICHLSTYALYGQNRIYLPLVLQS